MNHFKGAVSLSRAIEITYEGMSKNEQAKLDLAVRSLFPPQNKAMTPTPTPRTDEKANSWESTDGQWVNAEFARWLERELAAASDQLTANHEATNLMGKWLEAERELADRLAALIKRDRDGYGGQVVDPECNCCDCEYLRPIDESLAAWKEARSGTH